MPPDFPLHDCYFLLCSAQLLGFIRTEEHGKKGNQYTREWALHGILCGIAGIGKFALNAKSAFLPLKCY